MKISYDSQIFSLQAYGGISRYFYQLANNLSTLDQSIRIHAAFYRNKYICHLPKDLVTGRYLPKYPPRSDKIIRRLNSFLSSRDISNWKPNIIHETYYSLESVTLCRAPRVITVYDMIHELFSGQFLARDNISKKKINTINRADKVICISNNTKNDLMRLFNVDEKKIEVVYLGFDKLTCGDHFKPSMSKPYLLYVGTREGYKNFDGLLRAISSSTRLSRDFDVCTFGGPKFTKREVEMISHLGLSGQIYHLNGSDELLGMLYKGARAFVYPSLYEGFGIPPLEAMAQNCPVIASNASSIPEVIGGAGEFFLPNKIDSIRHAIESVVYSDFRISELRVAGKARVEYFSWEKCARETLNIYKTLN